MHFRCTVLLLPRLSNSGAAIADEYLSQHNDFVGMQVQTNITMNNGSHSSAATNAIPWEAVDSPCGKALLDACFQSIGRCIMHNGLLKWPRKKKVNDDADCKILDDELFC